MKRKRSVAVAVVGVLGAVLIALWVSGATSPGGYPLHLAAEALVVAVAAVLGTVLVVFLLVRRWL